MGGHDGIQQQGHVLMLAFLREALKTDLAR